MITRNSVKKSSGLTTGYFLTNSLAMSAIIAVPPKSDVETARQHHG
jgi:outer membrane protein W